VTGSTKPKKPSPKSPKLVRGSARLVDPVTNEDLAMTVIFEYRLPGAPDSTGDDTSKRQLWSQRWHNLGNYAFGDPTYNQLLENITTAFAKHGGGSSIHQLRTNEIALSQNPMVSREAGPSLVWELREWPSRRRRAARREREEHAIECVQPRLTARSVHCRQRGHGHRRLDRLCPELRGAKLFGFESHEQFDATKWTFDTTTPKSPGICAPRSACSPATDVTMQSSPPFRRLERRGLLHVSPLVPPSGATDDTAGTERLSNFVKNIDIPRRQQFMTSQLGSATNLTGATNFDK